MKQLKVWFAVALIFSAITAATAQPRRSPVSAAPPPDKVGVTPDPDEPLANFAEKGLPEPPSLGLRPSAALAKTTAARILRQDPESLSILTAALQKAGFHIVDANQKTLFAPTGPAIGARFYDFEVAGMLRATGFGAVTTVEKLGRLITNNDPDLNKIDLPGLLLRDMRSARTSKDPQAEFIANLIFELGKGTSDLATATPASARINLIQASLIERVFLGDLLDAFERFAEQNALMHRPRRLFDRSAEVQFVAASWKRSAAGPCEDIADVSTLVGVEGKTKKVLGKVFDKETLPSYLTGPKEFIKKRFEGLAKGIERANLLSSYAKVVMANMNIQADISVADPMPLVRTKSDREYDEQRRVTAKFTIDFKHSETINCVGKALKASTGMEVEVPKDGPMKDVPVKWEPIMEGDGYAKFSDYPVTVMADDDKKQDISIQSTNANGENKIVLFGKPQARNLTNEPVVPKAKRARLNVSVATENMDASEDIPKIFWFGFEGDFGLKAFIEIIPDILAKMALKTYKVSVPVRDWQPCSEDWGGFVNYNLDVSKTIVVKANRTSNGNSTGDGIRRTERHVAVNVTLNPRTQEDIAAKKEPRPADFRVSGRYSDIFDGNRDGDPCCGPAEGVYKTKFRSGSETKFLGSFSRRFYLSFGGGDRDYSLGFNFTGDPVNGRHHNFFEILDTNCPLEYSEEKSEYSDTQITISETLADGRYGRRVLNEREDLLIGTKEIPIPGGAVKWEWALARCKK